LEKRAGILKLITMLSKRISCLERKVAASWDDIKVESLHLEKNYSLRLK
jgi:hypothetical protein